MLCTSLEYHLVVNFPLLALSVYFPLLLPLGFASTTLSLAVSILAAAQAGFPPGKTRFWSRPLVAWLFFLQPLVRGWARYRTRLHLRSASGSAIPAPAPLPRRSEAPEQLCFWSRNGVDRYAFLKTILANFACQNVQTTPDSGWDRHDMEIVSSPWTRSSLTTASEYLAEGRIFLRCRFKAKWSLPAIVVFALLLGIEFLLIKHFAQLQPWLWMILPILPLVAWFFADECRQQSFIMAGAVGSAAEELKLEPFQPAQPGG